MQRGCRPADDDFGSDKAIHLAGTWRVVVGYGRRASIQMAAVGLSGLIALTAHGCMFVHGTIGTRHYLYVSNEMIALDEI